MSVFADSSAVVKIYADEEGSDFVRGLDLLVVSHLTRVEVPAALWRKSRMGELDVVMTTTLVSRFADDIAGQVGRPSRYLALKVSDAVLDDAAALCAVHRLRAYDAVQLASARALRHADPECGGIVVFDGLLREAAAREGFAVLPAA